MVRKLRPREGQGLAHSHTAPCYQEQGLHWGLRTPSSCTRHPWVCLKSTCYQGRLLPTPSQHSTHWSPDLLMGPTQNRQITSMTVVPEVPPRPCDVCLLPSPHMFYFLPSPRALTRCHLLWEASLDSHGPCLAADLPHGGTSRRGSMSRRTIETESREGL